MNLHEHQSTILFTSGIVAFLSIPFWWFISNKIGKKFTWLLSSTLTLLAFIIFYFYQINSLNELLFLVAFIGFGSGAGGILFWSMLPDTIEYGEVLTGVRSESSLYGFMTFAQKGSIAFAVIILGIVLDTIGFKANEVQAENTLTDMKLIMTLIPSLGIASSLVIIYFYPIDATMHKNLLKKLQEVTE